MRLKAGDRAEGFKSHRGRSEKKLAKPLDKPPTLCYNRDTAGARAHSPHWLGKARSETHESRVRPIKSERARPAIQIQ